MGHNDLWFTYKTFCTEIYFDFSQKYAFVTGH